mgnify:CR=1 FL=1
MARQPREIHGLGSYERDVDEIGLHAPALRDDRLDRADVLAPGDHALGQEKAGRQFLVVAGRAHGHRHRAALDADFQRLLDGEVVAVLGDHGVPLPLHRASGVGNFRR